MKIGQLEIDLEELEDFVAKAKRNSYTNGTGKRRGNGGTEFHVFQEGNFHYTGSYGGSYQSFETEIVRWQKTDGERIWRMCHSGLMSRDYWGNSELKDKIFGFLGEMLMADFGYAFKGPSVYDGKDLKCVVKAEGDIQRFSGSRHITGTGANNVVLFSQNFLGGLVTPK